MKRKETKKLFYKKYLYKIDIVGDYTRLFSKWNNPKPWNYSNAINYAETLVNEIKNKKEIKIESRMYWRAKEFVLLRNDVFAFHKVAQCIKDSQDQIRTRQEYQTLSIYTSDYDLIDKLIKDKNIFCTTLWEPDTNAIDLLLKNQEIIVVHQPPEYEYKLTFKGGSNGFQIANWIESNKNKIKITDYSLFLLKKGYTSESLTLYVRDNKVLTLAQMLIGKDIKRIEKLVYVEEN